MDRHVKWLRRRIVASVATQSAETFAIVAVVAFVVMQWRTNEGPLSSLFAALVIGQLFAVARLGHAMRNNPLNYVFMREYIERPFSYRVTRFQGDEEAAHAVAQGLPGFAPVATIRDTQADPEPIFDVYHDPTRLVAASVSRASGAVALISSLEHGRILVTDARALPPHERLVMNQAADERLETVILTHQAAIATRSDVVELASSAHQVVLDSLAVEYESYVALGPALSPFLELEPRGSSPFRLTARIKQDELSNLPSSIGPDRPLAPVTVASAPVASPRPPVAPTFVTAQAATPGAAVVTQPNVVAPVVAIADVARPDIVAPVMPAAEVPAPPSPPAIAEPTPPIVTPEIAAAVVTELAVAEPEVTELEVTELAVAEPVAAELVVTEPVSEFAVPDASVPGAVAPVAGTPGIVAPQIVLPDPAAVDVASPPIVLPERVVGALVAPPIVVPEQLDVANVAPEIVVPEPPQIVSEPITAEIPVVRIEAPVPPQLAPPATLAEAVPAAPDSPAALLDGSMEQSPHLPIREPKFLPESEIEPTEVFNELAGVASSNDLIAHAISAPTVSAPTVSAVAVSAPTVLAPTVSAVVAVDVAVMAAPVIAAPVVPAVQVPAVPDPAVVFADYAGPAANTEPTPAAEPVAEFAGYASVEPSPPRPRLSVALRNQPEPVAPAAPAPAARKRSRRKSR